MRNIKHMVTPDLVVSALLSIAVIVGMVMGTPTEVLTGLVGGLTGYLGKTVQDSFLKDDAVTVATVEAAVTAALRKQGIGDSVSTMIADNAVKEITKKGDNPK